MNKVLLFTDLHLLAEGQTLFGLDPGARFAAGLDHALRHHGDADALVLMGDLVHTGQREEYLRLRRILDRVDIPVVFMMGNHDRRDSFAEVFPEVPATAGGFYQHRLSLGDDRLLCLDTLDGPPYRPGHHAGVLDAPRRAWLEAELAAAPGRVIVTMHHPPMSVGIPAMDRIRLADGEGLLALLRRSGKVALLICGHVHRGVAGSTGGVAFAVLESACHRIPLDLRGGGSHRVESAPGAYGVLLPGKDPVLHREEFDRAPASLSAGGREAPAAKG